MKKILLYTLLSIGLFTACKKDNSNLIDGKKPEERVIEAMTKYSGQLTSSEFGWKAYLYPAAGGGYSFYLKFDTANRVIMYADLDYDPAQVSMESSYRIKSNQVPSLVFDTYNYMHILADPDPNTFGGYSGWGLYSDFEFNFNEEKGDTLKLSGKLLGSQFVMIKATKAEQDSYLAKGLYNSLLTSIDFFDENPNTYVLLGDETKIQTSFDYYNKVASLTWEEDGVVSTTSTGFVFTLTGILLQNPLDYKGKKVSEFFWDPVKNIFYAMVDGVRIEIIVSATPILPLHALIGISYSVITVPYATSYPGWSADFIARRARAAAATLAGGYNLRLEKMVFTFNVPAASLSIDADIYQNTSRFVGTFPYTFTKTAAGVYKFTAIPPSGNAGLIVTQMAALTTERINVDHFTLDYFVNPNTGALLGQFKSVEHPDFTFAGTLQ